MGFWRNSPILCLASMGSIWVQKKSATCSSLRARQLNPWRPGFIHLESTPIATNCLPASDGSNLTLRLRSWNHLFPPNITSTNIPTQRNCTLNAMNIMFQLPPTPVWISSLQLAIILILGVQNLIWSKYTFPLFILKLYLYILLIKVLYLYNIYKVIYNKS
jgi:hypothetical protein